MAPMTPKTETEKKKGALPGRTTGKWTKASGLERTVNYKPGKRKKVRQSGKKKKARKRIVHETIKAQKMAKRESGKKGGSGGGLH